MPAFKTTVIDGEEYMLVPMHVAKRRQRVLRNLKEYLRCAMLYPDLNCKFPLDLYVRTLKDLLGNQWSEYVMTLKAEILSGLADDDADASQSVIESSDRPYFYSEYMEDILPRYMSEETLTDFWNADI